MSDIPLYQEPNDPNDIWSLANSLPLPQAIALARARAAQGEVASLAFLAMAVQDLQERMAFRQQAADSGDLHSILELAGQSLASHDYAQARLWFERAAAQASVEAHVHLGIMLARGQGVPPDPINAITRICAARSLMEQDTFFDFVLGEQDFPFDVGDPDVYYPQVIERIFGECSAQEKQQVYTYLHSLGIEADSDDESWVLSLKPPAGVQSVASMKLVATPSPPLQTRSAQIDTRRFAPYRYNITPVRCGNRACAWQGIMTQSDHQRCPVCRHYPLRRNGSWQLLNGSDFAKQRETLVKRHARALRTVTWYLYATPRDFQALATVWGNAPFHWNKHR